jgi:hypothetical protein
VIVFWIGCSVLEKQVRPLAVFAAVALARLPYALAGGALRALGATFVGLLLTTELLSKLVLLLA